MPHGATVDLHYTMLIRQLPQLPRERDIQRGSHLVSRIDVDRTNCLLI